MRKIIIAISIAVLAGVTQRVWADHHVCDKENPGTTVNNCTRNSGVVGDCTGGCTRNNNECHVCDSGSDKCSKATTKCKTWKESAGCTSTTRPFPCGCGSWSKVDGSEKEIKDNCS